jgi:hypothetical protein
MKSNLDFFTLERFSESALTLNLLRKHLLQLAVTGVLYSVDDWDERMLEELSSQPIIDGDWIESKDQDPSGDIRLLQLADVGEGFFKDKSQRFVNNDTFKRLNCTPLEKDDVLIARLPDPIGRACLFPELSQKCITVVDVAIVKVEREVILPEYLVMLMNSPAMNLKIIDHSAGTTRQRVATGKLKKMTVVFPSKLESQQNIIDRYKELKAIVERLDFQRQKRAEIAVFARNSAVAAVSTAQSPDELRVAWERIKQNWEVMTDTANSVSDLRKLIETLGVRGYLTEKIDSENSAENLLRDLGLNGKVFTTDTMDIVPRNWAFTNLGAVIQLEYGKSLPKQVRSSQGDIPVYGSNGIVGHHDQALIENGSIVVGRKGSIGQVNIARGDSWIIDTAYYVIPKANMSLEYLALLIKTSNLQSLNKATAIPGLNRNDAYSQMCFLAPPEEQIRIVQTVNALLEVCDRLAEVLQERENIASKFARSVVSESA